MTMNNNKYYLIPLSFHGHKLEDMLRAFLRVRPEK